MSASGSTSTPPDAWLNDPSAVLDELLEQQRATTEVLLVVGRSRFELEPIFETVLNHAMRLCRADAGQIFIHEGDHYRLGWASGGSDEYRSMLATRRIPVGPGTLVGRVALERRAVLSKDISTDPEFDTEEQRLRQRLGGFRTIVGVPIQSDDDVIGVISLWRHEVRPFATREIQLATTFAAQGAIAIRNASLMRQLELRTKELARSVEQLEGLNDVGQAVSSSLDLQEVLSMIVRHAVELSRTEGGSIFEFDDESQEFRVRTAYGTSEELLSALRAVHVGLHDTFVGRASQSGTPMAVDDIAAAPRDVHLDCLLRDGWKSMLAVPLTRDDRILGALVVRRRTTGDFPTQITELLETFASQSALAIHNARLFHELERQAAELEGWNRELEERVAEQVAEIERMARLKRFLPPQLAELVVSSGDDSFLESHRREITVVFCDLLRLHRLRRDVGARGHDADPSRVPRRPRRARPSLRGDARAVHGGRTDGVLQRSRSMSRPVRPCGPDGSRDAEPRRRARGPGGAAADTRWASRSGSRRATRRWGESASRAVPTTRRSAA